MERRFIPVAPSCSRDRPYSYIRTTRVLNRNMYYVCMSCCVGKYIVEVVFYYTLSPEKPANSKTLSIRGGNRESVCKEIRLNELHKHRRHSTYIKPGST